MGRDRTNRTRRYFKYDSVSKTSTCQIEDCQHVVSGDHGGNLERHLQRHHKEVYDNIQADKAYSTKRVAYDEAEGSPAAKHRQVYIQNMFKPISPKCVSLEITEDSIMNSCVELVTRHGRPFRLIDDSGFWKIIDPVLKALNAKRAITTETVKDRVQEEAKSKREEISQSLKNGMFSLKIDSASRLDRALLGINAQYAENGKLILQPLAMNKFYDRHTAEHLTSQVKNTLSRYDLSVTQVYSVTTDNGANMLKAACLLSETDDEPDASSSDEDDDTGYPEFGYCGSLLDDSEEAECLGLDGADFKLGVRCAAHTLQLAVSDALKDSGSNTLIAECRAHVKKLRVQSAMGLIRKLGLRKPCTNIIDCPTRWMSTLNMLTRFVEVKDFAKDFLSREQTASWTDSMWAKVEGLIQSLQPAQGATKVLQTEQLTIGDFYGAWMTGSMKTSATPPPLAQALVQSMKKRERNLCSTNIFCAALYMDHRYGLLLTPDQKYQARMHLCKIWKRITVFTGLQQKQCCSFISESTAAPTSEGPEDALEEFLKTQEAEAGTESRLTSKPGLLDMVLLLEMLDKEPCLPRSTNMLKFWEERKERQPELYMLAQVALGVLATQVSVEREFSALKFVLSDQRSRLPESTLDDLLLLKSCTLPQ
ncbi:E3 SUMO-protein ligase ZBED1-like [Haemaphysalis longicornis]